MASCSLLSQHRSHSAIVPKVCFCRGLQDLGGPELNLIHGGALNECPLNKYCLASRFLPKVISWSFTYFEVPSRPHGARLYKHVLDKAVEGEVATSPSWGWLVSVLERP